MAILDFNGPFWSNSPVPQGNQAPETFGTVNSSNKKLGTL